MQNLAKPAEFSQNRVHQLNKAWTELDFLKLDRKLSLLFQKSLRDPTFETIQRGSTNERFLKSSENVRP